MKSIVTKLALIGLPVLAAAALAAPASAHPSTTSSVRPSSVVPASSTADCPLGDLCFWVDANWIGKMGMVSGNNGSWTKFAEPQCNGGTWNDCASAIYNHGQYSNARVFKDDNGGGGGSCLPRGTMWSNLTSHYFDNGVKMNDQISSNDWVSSACP
ncbi:peptidase inhibitor family I36 protein [Rugosimonospora africana]|uniref:Peptidase inhibitor family I36 n=1 Tax=Rugosimonospora africana TaxID=556532 RepID=A0A8J3R3H2_9ACTN|nr:peptidase inhibitor family I36 protein [Rugosimonospora africana]GIH19431.1 hypothetical protein Raf01_76030 [Rugosimonospora africana]